MGLLLKTFEKVRENFEYDYFWQNPFVYDLVETTLGRMQEKGLLDKLKPGQTKDSPCLYVMLSEYPDEPIPLSINNVKIFCNDPMDTFKHRVCTKNKKAEKCQKLLLLTLMGLYLSTGPLKKRI